MDATERFSEIAEILAHIPADSETAEVNTGWIFAGNHHRFAVLTSLGDMVATATFDIDVEQAQDSSGTGAKNVTSKSITQLTQAGGDGDQVTIIELKGTELDVSGGFDYIQVEVTPAVAAVEFAVFLLGLVPRFAPVSTTNVEEIVD
jgi:flagellin-like hook-associated protein FlgL